MAIEQLTGVLKAPNVKLTTTAESYSSSLVKKQQQLTDLESNLMVMEDKNSEKAKELTATVVALKKDLKETQRGSAKAQGNIEVETDRSLDSTMVTAASVEVITAAILSLVEQTSNNTDKVNSMFVCTDILQTSSFRDKAERVASKASASTAFTPLEKACENYVGARLSAEASTLGLKTEYLLSPTTRQLIKTPSGLEQVSKAIQAITNPPTPPSPSVSVP